MAMTWTNTNRPLPNWAALSLVRRALLDALQRDPELHYIESDEEGWENVCDCDLCEKLRKALEVLS